MHDGVRFVAWFAATGLLVGGSWSTVRRLFPGDPWSLRLMHGIVLSWAVLVGVSLLLGGTGLLSPIVLLTSVPLAACSVWLGVRLRYGRCGVEAVGAGATASPKSAREAAAAVETFGRGECAGGDPRTTGTWGWGVAWACLAAVAAAHVFWNGMAAVPRDWDSSAYHVPLVAHWLREGSLYVPDCAFWYCPGNNELWALWLAAPFSGDYLVALNNVPATILLATSPVNLGRLLGLSRPMYHVAAMAMVATTPVIRQLVSQENDVAVVALFLGALAYGVRYARDGRLADAVFGAACGGLLAGIKYYALGYTDVALVAVVGLCFHLRGGRPAVRTLMIGLIGGLLLGAYWYARNAWFSGTPLFPKGLTASTDVWGAMRPESHTSTLLRSGRWEVWPLLADAIGAKGGPCVLAAVSLLPLTCVWLAAGSARRSLEDGASPGQRRQSLGTRLVGVGDPAERRGFPRHSEHGRNAAGDDEHVALPVPPCALRDEFSHLGNPRFGAARR